jgi:hypothetical protein
MNPVTDLLQRSLQFARGLSEPDGRMRDPYETEYGENYSPACFSVVAAAAWRLHKRPEDREWAFRWGHRAAAIMRESPYLREYMLGYTALVFTLLDPSPELERLRQDFVASSQPEEALSPLGHILALQLVGDVLCPRNSASSERAEQILTLLEELWTPAGFPEDRKERDDGSIPHAYLTVSCLIIFLLAKPASESARKLQPRIEALIRRACDWFYQANGPAIFAVQANRSYNQLWTYPLYALLAYVHRGAQAAPVIEQCLAVVTRTTGNLARPNFLPTALSPYASAGNEPYNRVNNDIGAGGVGWALLAVLQAGGFKGLAPQSPAPKPVFVDADAGYAFFHSEKNGTALVLRQHKWHYHLPLQPTWLVLDGATVPFVGAKRAGVNHPLTALISEPARINPWLEPYFGVLAATKAGIYHRMAEPVNSLPENVFQAALQPAGAATALAALVSVQVVPEADGIVFTYRLSGEPIEEMWLSIPTLLWDGAHELGYRIKGATVELEWAGHKYALTAKALADAAGGNPGSAGLMQSWLLRRERFNHTGFGVTGNFALALGQVRAVRVKIRKHSP